MPPLRDRYLHDLYDQLNESPMQRKLRALRPWPVGVVFIQRPGMTLYDMRAHFRLMRELGFTCLKQCELLAGEDWRAVYHAALDEGIIPWWYDEAGGEEPTPELLRQLGLPLDLALDEIRAHPVWRVRQEQLMRARIEGPEPPPVPVAANETDGLPGTLTREVYGVPAEAAALFTTWLRDRYRTITALKQAWNFHHCMVRSRPWRTWADVRREVVEFVNAERQEYRRIVDVYRFRGDKHLEKVAHLRDQQLRRDPRAPVRSGGEMSLFLPFAARSTDMEGIASVMRTGGSFYPSMHPGWHFEETDFEFVRPIYMQASLAVDWFKGGWAATWESTGGPQQLSGGKAPFVPEARSQVAGFTVDENTIQQLMLSWVAAGFKGFGQWCWNARSFGWEAGEYALLDRNQRPCGRTIAAGRIGQAARRWRDELWSARKEPTVGIFQDFESDAFWAAVAVGGRDMYQHYPVRARIGAARALINANVPWEHVTARNLRAGLADRYAAILLPAQLALAADVLELLLGYVERGGRLVLDAPGGWYGYDGCLLPTDDGSIFERLFGCRIGDYQYSRSNHTTWRVGRQKLAGFVLDLQPTRARVTASFADGRPAVTEHAVGRGRAVVLGFEASLACWRPGQLWHERQLVRATSAGLPRDFTCTGAIAYRLAAPAADHYFLINDSDRPQQARLVVKAKNCHHWEDAISGERLARRAPVALPARGARWIRCAH